MQRCKIEALTFSIRELDFFDKDELLTAFFSTHSIANKCLVTLLFLMLRLAF